MFLSIYNVVYNSCYFKKCFWNCVM